MKRVFIYIYSLIFLFFTLSFSDDTTKKEIIYSKTEVIVQLKSSPDENKLLSDYPESKHILLNFYSVKVPKNKKVEEFIQEIEKKEYVQYAEFNYGYKLTAVPSDPYFNEQWGLERIHAPEAWNYTTGSDTVYVAVIDDGVFFHHPDLEANIWRNPYENCDNGIDDDNNGYIDDCYGWSAVRGKGSAIPEGSHGTHVAGIIGAVGNNGIGVSGVNWNVKIVPCTAGGGTVLFLEDIAECFAYIQKLKYLKGMNIVAINASWGGHAHSKLEKKVLDILKQYDILLVVAAGNDSANNDDNGSYPCAYDSDTVLCVGASDESDSRAWFSNYGKNTVDIFAPGVNILSTVTYYKSPYGNYDFFDGTSMATPFVTGAVALTKALYPNLNHAELKKKVISSGDVIDSIFRFSISGKRLNLENIVNGYQSATYNFNTPDLYFDELNPGQEQSKVIKVISTGELPLRIDSIDLTKDKDFYIKSENCTGRDLNFYKECSITIVFKPTSGYEKSSSFLVLHSNAQNSQKLYLEGHTKINPKLVVEPKEIVFKNINVGEESEEKEIIIKNDGIGNLKVEKIYTEKNNSDFLFDFSGCPPVPFYLKKSESCTVKVKYAPSQEGTTEENLIIEAHAGNLLKVKTVKIYATTQKLPDLQLNKNKFYFETSLGETSPPEIIKISNKGKADLKINDIRIDCLDKCKNDFILDYNAGTKPCRGKVVTISPNDYCTFSLRYRPTDYNRIRAYLYINSNDTFHKDKNVAKIYADSLNVQITVYPTEIEFEELQIDDKSEFKTITIKNSSQIDAQLNVKNIILENNIDFTVDNGTCGNLPFELNRGESCQIKVRFNPKSKGDKKTKLKIINNDYENSNIYVKLKGEGVKKYPVIDVNPEEIDFGNVQVGKISDEKVVTIENIGMLPLEVDSFEIDDNSFFVDYKGGNNPCNSSSFTLQPKESCTVGIRFAPNNEDDFETKIEINTNKKDGKIKVYGNGTRGIPPRIGVSTERIDFGKVVVNETKKQEIIISNKTLKSKLVVNDIELSDKENFAVNYNGGSNPCGSSSFILPENSECTIELSFVPSKDKKFKTDLKIYSNDSEDDDIKIKIYGEGINIPPAKMYLSSKELDFGAIQIGHERTKEIEIKNIGEGDLKITEFKLKSDNFKLLTNYGSYPCNSSTPTITPNHSCTVGIKFIPDDDDKFKSRLEIRSNDSYSSKQKVYLYGKGTEIPEGYLYVKNEEIDFGAVGIGSEKTKELKISNLGEGDLKITEFKLKSDNFKLLTNYGSYPCNSSTPTITPNHSCTVGIKFIPDDDDKFKSHLEIKTEDDKEKVKLYGIGVKDKQPFIIVEPIEINFEDTLIGNSSIQELKIKNIGQKDLKIYEIEVSDSKVFELLTNYGSNPCGSLTPTIKPDYSCSIGIKFKPYKEKRFKSSLKIKSNDEKIKISMYGRGWEQFPPQINVTPLRYDFGKLKIGQKTPPVVVKIENNGKGILNIERIRNDDSNFILNFDGGDKPCGNATPSITPHEYCTFEVMFQPKSKGTKKTTIEIRSNDNENDKIKLKMRGEGLKVYGKIEVSPDSIYFSDEVVPVGYSVDQEIIIRNKGSDNLIIEKIKLSDDDNFILDPNYGLNKPCGSLHPVIKPHDYCTIHLIFRPVEEVRSHKCDDDGENCEWKRAAYIKIESNDIDDYEPYIPIFADSQEIGDKRFLYVEPKIYDFEFTDVGKESKPIEIRLENQNEADITLYKISDKDLDHFKLDLNGGSKPCGTFPVTVKKGDYCTITAVFKPTSEGFKEDSFTIKGKHPYSIKEKVVLTGRTTKDEPYIQIVPRYIDFEEIYIKTLSGIKTVTIRNVGTRDLVINNISEHSDYVHMKLDDGDKPCGDTFPITLAPNDYCTFSVAFEADTEERETATIKVDSNDPYSSEYYITVTGIGILPSYIGGGCSFINLGNNLPVYLLIPIIVAFRRYIRKKF